jgi:hypothetical protein
MMAKRDQTEISGTPVVMERMGQMAHVRAIFTAALAIQAQMAPLEETEEMAQMAGTDKAAERSCFPLSKASRIPWAPKVAAEGMVAMEEVEAMAETVETAAEAEMVLLARAQMVIVPTEDREVMPAMVAEEVMEG